MGLASVTGVRSVRPRDAAAVRASSIAASVDTALTDRVLVVGSLPPLGRDLDPLVRLPQHRQVVEWGAASGKSPV